MKRTPLKRKTPLRAKSKRRSKYKRRPRAIDYMLWVKTLSCCASSFATDTAPCDGPIEADHAGERIAGMGTKSLDRDVIPLCRGHHRDRHAFDGPFSGWTRDQMRTWLDGEIRAARCRARAAGIEVPSC